MHELPISYCEKFIIIPETKNHLGFLGVDIRLIKGGSNMTGTDLYVNKPHCAATVRP